MIKEISQFVLPGFHEHQFMNISAGPRLSRQGKFTFKIFHVFFRYTC